MKRAIVISMTAPLVALVACSDLFDSASQCTTDRDCEQFHATCDIAHAVCVPYGPLDSEGGVLPDGAPAPSDAADEAPVVDPACDLPNKESATVPATDAADAGDANITSDVTLACSKDWILKSRIYVQPGATITIQAGTTIRAEANAGLVIMPGARIVARGTSDRPIVFTPNVPAGTAPTVGSWRGVYVFGNAPPAGGTYNDPTYTYGGNNEEDNSGALEFVRIEYSGGGLVFGGVGRSTQVDHVEVRKADDNCFTAAGGRVNLKYLVCQFPADEMLELGAGYQGRVQFFYGQKTPATGAEHHGLLVDGANTSPVIYNLTMCGNDTPPLGYGLIVRNAATVDLNGAIITGWFAGLDFIGTVAATTQVRGSIAFGNATNPAYDENQTTDNTQPTFDDDNGFDENGFFNDAARANKTTDPGLGACFDPNDPKPWPAAAIADGARTPPNDGFFDATAVYVGAFKDGADPWMKGAWVRFADK